MTVYICTYTLDICILLKYQKSFPYHQQDERFSDIAVGKM